MTRKSGIDGATNDGAAAYRRMRRVAAALLVAMAILFLIARLLAEGRGALARTLALIAPALPAA